MTRWIPPGPRAPQQSSPARIEPTPLECTARDIGSPGAPIVITKVGIEYVERLAAIGANDTAIANALRMDRQTFRNCKNRQPDVAEALASGRATLGLEVMNHWLSAARGGDLAASVAIARFRLGWGGGAASSTRPDEDDLPKAEESKKEIDWSKVDDGEREFILLVLGRLSELQGDKNTASMPWVVGHDERMRSMLRLHASLSKLDHHSTAPLITALIDFVDGVRDPAKGIGRSEVDALCAQLRLTPAEMQMLQALKLTPHERRQLADGSQPFAPSSDDASLDIDIDDDSHDRGAEESE